MWKMENFQFVWVIQNQRSRITCWWQQQVICCVCVSTVSDSVLIVPMVHSGCGELWSLATLVMGTSGWDRFDARVNTTHYTQLFLCHWVISLLQAVPDGVQTDLEHLKVLVLVDNDHIRRFAEDSLPMVIGDRLNVLFIAREKWTLPLSEISPFIEPLSTKKLNVNALLTKCARPLNINGVKYFCSKHGK